MEGLYDKWILLGSKRYKPSGWREKYNDGNSRKNEDVALY
jgi:hypothetical protein